MPYYAGTKALAENYGREGQQSPRITLGHKTIHGRGFYPEATHFPVVDEPYDYSLFPVFC